VDYTDVLRSLAVGDAEFATRRLETMTLDPKSLALARLAALVAIGGAVASYGAETDAAVSQGATTAEIVDVLVGIVSVVGLPRVVAAAPRVAMALGHDIHEGLELESGD
jgi:4-carboxymuconolactone decarboxylase